MTKVCTKCKIKKEFCEFHKQKDSRSGLRPHCKVCRGKYQKQYQETHQEEVSAYQKQWKLDNPHYQKEWRINNKEDISAYNRQWNKDNPEYFKQKYKDDLNYKISSKLRSRLSVVIKNLQKSGSAINDLQCSLEHAVQHMVKRYNREFAAQDYKLGRIPNPYITVEQLSQLMGKKGLHIDHIVPLSGFNLSNREELLKACHYSNLRLMWWSDNLSKGNKVI